MKENAYTKAGVDVNAGYETVDRIKKHIQKTNRLGSTGSIGGFGGLFDLGLLNLKEPIMVSGTDGVGTKLMLAIMADKHDTIGIDCVAMCVNDVIAQGAQPLFFLDYIATGKAIPSRLEQIVKGVSDGCVMSNCALIGGETAEMPGMYKDNDYDLAGFCVGAVEKKDIIDLSKMKEGDVLIGIASSGIHSNGFSLVRKIFFDTNKFDLNEKIDGNDKTLIDLLIEPTKIYVKPIMSLLKEVDVHGISHITGGGFVENIPRMLTGNLCANIKKGTWDILPIFELLIKYGKLSEDEVYEIFNMGIGMVVAVGKEDLTKTLEHLNNSGEKAYEIGYISSDENNKIIIS